MFFLCRELKVSHMQITAKTRPKFVACESCRKKFYYAVNFQLTI